MLQAVNYCELIRSINAKCLKQTKKRTNVEMMVFSPKVQYFYFCGTLVMVITVPYVYAIL